MSENQNIPDDPKIYRQRLLNVVRALRESPKPKAFSMDWYGYGPNEAFPCGTPQCALGHYAAREDLQDFLRLGCDDAQTTEEAASYIERFAKRRFPESAT